ncbi:MAG: hypothetical protein ABR584_09395 [Candidatus Baltobacteraceae bacterium]
MASTNTPLLYVTLVATSAETLNGIPGYTLTLPASVPNGSSIYVAQYVAGAWTTVLGPATSAIGTVTIPASSKPLALPGGTPVNFAVYIGGFLGPTTASLNLTTTGGAFFSGLASTQVITVNAKDGRGNTITGLLSSPVALTTTDKSGSITLSATAVTMGGESVTASYNGSGSVPGVVLTATDGNGKTASTTLSSNDDHPVIAGSTSTFTTTSTVTTTSGSRTPVVRTRTASNVVTLTTGASFNSLSNLIQVNSVRTQISPSPIPSTPPNVSNDYLIAQPVSNGLQLAEVGFSETYLSLYITTGGTSTACATGAFTTTNNAPYPVLDSLPHSSPATGPLLSAYTNQSSSTPIPGASSACGQYIYTDTTQYAIDGSYADHYVTPALSGASASYPNIQDGVLNPDGSGSSTSSYPNGLPPGSPITADKTVTTFSVPAPSGITVTTMTYPGNGTSTPAPSATPIVNTTVVPNWLPNKVAIPLISETVTQSLATIPARCGLPTTLPTAGSTTHVVFSSVDPLAGSTNTSTSDNYYLPGVGLVCSITNYQYVFFDNVMSGATAFSQTNSHVMSLNASSLKPDAFSRSLQSATWGIPSMVLQELHEAVAQSHDLAVQFRKSHKNTIEH